MKIGVNQRGKTRKVINMFWGFLICAVGILVLVVGGMANNQHSSWIENEATIVKIDAVDEYDPIENTTTTNYTVYVDYTYEGTTYTNVQYPQYVAGYEVGKVVTALVNPDNPSEIDSKGGEFVYAIGGALVVVGGLLIGLTIAKINKSKKYLEAKEDTTAVDYGFEEDSSTPKGDIQHYFFKPSGKMNQGYSIIDENDHSVYDVVLTKFRLLTACDYSFNNNVTYRKTEHKLGKVVSTESGNGHFSMGTGSYFNYDGIEIWDYLKKHKLRINIEVHSLKEFKFTIDKNGVNIASASMAGPLAWKKDAKFAGIPSMMFYKVDTYENCLDDVMICLIALSRCGVSTLG